MSASRWRIAALGAAAAAAAMLATAALAGPLLQPTAPTSTPTAAPTATPAPTATRAPTATPPTPTPAPAGDTVRVSSVAALLTELADNDVTDIVVENGTYHVSAAASKRADSLWIGARFAGRTKAVVVRAESTGGVTFDGGGTGYFGGITFVEGAHHQTWQGFRFANGRPTETGVIVFGGYQGLAAPHHITLRDITLPSSITSPDSIGDHAVYFSWAAGGPHDILIDGMTVNGNGGIESALHFYHSDSANRNAWNVTVRDLSVTGTRQAIMLWDPTLRDIAFEDVVITDARAYAIRFEADGARGITFTNVTSTGSGEGFGFYSSLGGSPAGISFTNASLL